MGVMCDKQKDNSLELTILAYGNYLSTLTVSLNPSIGFIKHSEAFIHGQCQLGAGLKRIVLSG